MHATNEVPSVVCATEGGSVIPQEVANVLARKSRYAILCTDGFALARELADGAVDLVIADPPFDAKTHAGIRTNKKGTNGKIEVDFNVCPAPSTFVPDLLRVSKRWVICKCAQEMTGDYQRAANYDGEERYIRGGIWPKTNPTPQKTGDRPAQWGESCAIMHRTGRKRWNGGGRPASWPGPSDNDPMSEHPTKTPLWLMEAWVRDFGETGEIVFDPTAGEATVGEACLRLGLSYIGCEIIPKYHKLAVTRLARAASAGIQMTLPSRAPRPKQEVLFR
jgi:site-specific DNA-methyltransferase (adenine-specific)